MDSDVPLEQDMRPKPPPRMPFRTYGYIVKQSRRIGRLAVHALGDVKAILVRDIVGVKPELAVQTSDQQTSQQDAQPKLDEIRSVASQSHEVLASARSVFPFMLFPDSILLDRTKVSISKRGLFSEDSISIRVEDVLNVSAHTGVLFSTLNIASRVMNSTDHFQVKTLWITDALRLKRLIQGYVIAQHNNIKIAHLSREELIDALNELGQDQRR